MNKKALIQAIKITALLSIMQDEIDLLEQNGYNFSFTLKKKANMFKEELDKSIVKFCNTNGGISNEAFVRYAELSNVMQDAMNIAFADNIIEKIK